MPQRSFRLESKFTVLTVTTNGQAVTRIEFAERTNRQPESPLEIQVESELQQYFAGVRKEFTFPVATSGSDFSRLVWKRVSNISYGETSTYGDVARDIGRPGAARAVGTANGRNPIPIVIPCHRVVAADGRLGGFGGGVPLKRNLLELERTGSPGTS